MKRGEWYKPCESAHCLEVFMDPDGTKVAISATDDFNIVSVTRDEWDAFVADVKDGKFDDEG
jgi:hypothetical protein